MKTANPKIGHKIKELREKKGLSQDELARMIGYKSRSTINKIEKGKNDIPQSKIEKFASALGVMPVVLMGWDVITCDDPLPHRVASPILESKTQKLISICKDMTDKQLDQVLNYAKYIKDQKD